MCMLAQLLMRADGDPEHAYILILKFHMIMLRIDRRSIHRTSNEGWRRARRPPRFDLQASEGRTGQVLAAVRAWQRPHHVARMAANALALSIGSDQPIATVGEQDDDSAGTRV